TLSAMPMHRLEGADKFSAYNHFTAERMSVLPPVRLSVLFVFFLFFLGKQRSLCLNVGRNRLQLLPVVIEQKLVCVWLTDAMRRIFLWDLTLLFKAPCARHCLWPPIHDKISFEVHSRSQLISISTLQTLLLTTGGFFIVIF